MDVAELVWLSAQAAAKTTDDAREDPAREGPAREDPAREDTRRRTREDECLT